MDQLHHMFLVIAGLMIGIVAAIFMGAIRIGLQLAPWIIVGALVVWFLL